MSLNQNKNSENSRRPERSISNSKVSVVVNWKKLEEVKRKRSDTEEVKRKRSDTEEVKRKRSDTEFDSETESVCSNSQLLSSKMQPISSELLLGELAKARLRVDPYANFEGWNDDVFWATLMRTMFPHRLAGYTYPTIRNVMEAILLLQKDYLLSNYDISAHETVNNMHIVFGPKYDNGQFNSRLVNPAFLPWSSLIYEGETTTLVSALNLLPPSPSEDNKNHFNYTSDDVVTYDISVVLGGVSSKQSELSEKKRKKETAGASSSSSLDALLVHSNSQSRIHGKHFSGSEVGMVDQRGLNFIYYQDVKDFSIADQALLLKHCCPSGPIYGHVVLQPSSDRKPLLQEFLRQIKESEPPRFPSRYAVNLQ